VITPPRFPQIRTCALTHPAPRSKQSLRNLPSRTPWSKGHLNAVLAQSTIFCRCRKMSSRLKVRVIDASRRCFRPVGRFPPTGPLGRVPRAPRYYQPTPTTQPPSRRASLPSLGATLPLVPFAPIGRTGANRPGPLLTRRPHRTPRQGTAEPSQVPGRPLRIGPCSSTPAERRHQAIQCRPCCLPLFRPRRLRHVTFEAQSHSLHAPCVRFAGGITPTPRNTRFRWVANPYRFGTCTRRVT